MSHLVGRKAPDFDLPSTKNLETLDEHVRLEDYAGRWLCFFFYPLDFTFVCPTEITALSKRSDEFAQRGCDIVGCSTDSIFSHRAWINTPPEEGGLGPISYPLVSDLTKAVSRAYGVLDEEHGVAMRGLFLIDPDQNVRYQVVHDDNVGRSVDEALRVLEALQAGGLCQADWQAGEELIKV